MLFPLRFRFLFAFFWVGVFVQAVPAASYVLPPDDVGVVGQIETVQTVYEDTLADIARRYSLGFEEITKANPKVDAWVPGVGTTVVLPKRHILPDTPREGIVLNLPEMRSYFYPKPKKGEPPVVLTYPVSIGRLDWKTPLGLTSVVAKITNPTWTPPETIKREHAAEGDILPDVVPAGPENPLGLYALRLGTTGYLIHGTDKPWGIGMRVTHGCMRLYPEDIELLFKEVPVGTVVRLINQPFKAGWLAGTLYLQVYSPLEEDQETLVEENAVIKLLSKVLEGRPKGSYRMDGEAIRRAVTEQRGVPTPVGIELQ
ncbi:putative L,D-transpeptidase YbiS [Gammaproteobacteria bacterium]